MKPLLAIDGLHSGYGSRDVLQDVSLTVEEGEVVAIIGVNGAGKSTLLRTISGLVPVRAGHIRFAGAEMTRLHPSEVVRHGIIHVPEGRQIFAPLTVRENLLMGAYGHYRRQRDLEEQMAFVFGLFPVLRERLQQLAGTLSGGEQQMLALGRALMARPRLLMLDEPSLGLAPRVTHRIFSVLSDLNRNGLSILLVEQNAVMALSFARRAYVLDMGQVVLAGPAAALQQDPKVKQVYLGERAVGGVMP